MKKYLFVFLMTFILISCNRPDYKHFEKIPDNVWNRTYPVEFIVDIEEASDYQAYISVRHGFRYPADNILIKITAQPPTGDAVMQQYDLQLKTDKGKWKGEGMGESFDFEMEILNEYEFVQGTHTIKVEQELGNQLPFIRDVGLLIYKKEE